MVPPGRGNDSRFYRDRQSRLSVGTTLANMRHFLYRTLFGKETEEELVASSFLLACLGLIVATIAGVGFAIYRIYQEVSLELDYLHRYGVDWQTQYEMDRGTLSHAHAKLVVGGCCLLALAAVLIWFWRHTFHKHRKRKHDQPAA